MHLLRLSDAATDARYPRRTTRAMVIATSETEENIRAALTFYRQSMAPAEVDTILKHLLAMEVIYPSQQLTRDQKNLKYQIYYDALNDIPADLLERAFDAYVRRPRTDGKPKFFPDPSELRAIVDESIKDAHRLRRGLDVIAAALDDREVAPADEPLITVERMREIRAQHGIKTPEEIATDQREDVLETPRLRYVETPEHVKRARAAGLERIRSEADHYASAGRRW